LATIYGVDRATGAGAEAPGDAAQAMDEEEREDLAREDVQGDGVSGEDALGGADLGDEPNIGSEPNTSRQGTPQSTDTQPMVRRLGKRKAVESPLTTALISNIEKLGSSYVRVEHDLARIANFYDIEAHKEHDLGVAKRLIGAELEQIEGLTDDQVLSTYEYIMKDFTNLDCFIHLSARMRTSFVKKKVAEHTGYTSSQQGGYTPSWSTDHDPFA
jgi:hypothetical protein